jgi:hypothetical protein
MGLQVGDKIRIKNDPNVFPDFWGVVGIITGIYRDIVYLKSSDGSIMHGELKDVE